MWNDPSSTQWRDVRLIARLDGDLRHACRTVEALDRRSLRTLKPPLTPAQYHVLAALVATHSVSAVARRLDCDPGNVTGLLQRLAQQGLVERGRDPVDGRRAVISLTSAGQAALTAATQARLAALTQALDSVDQALLTAVTRHLRWLLEQLQQSAPEEERR